MIITRTPFRISFFGGGTDYPDYYKKYGGSCLNATINRYCYIACRYLPPFFDHKFVVRYSKKELAQTIDQIIHPSARECLKFMGIDKGVEIIHTSDLPAMSGIGSSSAFTVGLLNALYSLKGQMQTKRKLAFDAIHVEQELIRENVGSQDQLAVAFGGFNKIEFSGENEIFVQPVTIGKEKMEYFQNHFLFYFTGFSRFASEIAEEQIKRIPENLKELDAMKEMVNTAISILNGSLNSINDFGKLLDDSWILKKQLGKLISNNNIDQIYEAARSAGALGGKICGAGAGGFMVLFVPPENQPKVKEILKKLILVPFQFENIGSHVIHYTAY
ncbi:MAG: kinase [Candidatus Omnitrophica bacterium]|nr:kinase [Candidatus Omnitrophota bacterium]